jgi:tetratricopeptide (TPR) repeat protein
VHPDRLSAVAQLSLLLGNVSTDSGYDGLAQHYHHVAVHLAARGGDSALLAVAMCTMAAHAGELGHHTTAVVSLAERATRYAGHAPAITQAYAQAHLAVLQAHHDPHAALATLTRAERLHAGADAGPGPLTSYPAGALHYQRAQVLATLGDAAGAARALTASLRARTPTEHRAATLTRVRLAETCLRLGHLDQSLAHWAKFLDAYPSLHSARADQRLIAMRRQLRPHTLYPAAADVLRRAAALGPPRTGRLQRL